MRIQFGVVGFVEFLCYLMIAGFLIHTVTTQWPDSKAAQGLSFIF